VRLHRLYALLAAAVAVVLWLVSVLSEDCTKRPNALDIALCRER
jgi:hypothetical protein